MLKSKLFPAALFGLAALVFPVSVADTVAGTPDASVYHAPRKVGEVVASLPLLNEVTPSKNAPYYIYLCSAGWCGPCNREMPQVVEAYKEMKASGKVELLLVDYDRTEANARQFIEKYGVSFPAIMNSHANSLPGFVSPRGIPFAIIVDAEGNVIAKGYAPNIIQNWKSHIAACEDAQGVTLSFSSTRVYADVDEEEASDDGATGDKVAEAMQDVDWFNGKPSRKAEFYIYLQSASWCGPCRAEMPEIAKEYKAMKRSRRVELVLLSGDRSLSAAKSFLKGNKAKFPATMLNSDGVRKLPGVSSLPNYFPAAVIVKADGTVIKAGHGSIVKDWREYTIDAEE